jgi:hypothetical protein
MVLGGLDEAQARLLRHPRRLGLRDDMAPPSVEREQ